MDSLQQEFEEVERLSEESRLDALDIEDGMKSRYWTILRRKIGGWQESEKKHLDILNQRLIRLPEDVEERNDSVKRISMLNQFLKINETVRDECLSRIDGMARQQMPESFVNNFVTK